MVFRFQRGLPQLLGTKTLPLLNWKPILPYVVSDFSVFPPLQLPGATHFLKSQSDRSNKRSYREKTGVCIVCGGTTLPISRRVLQQGWLGLLVQRLWVVRKLRKKKSRSCWCRPRLRKPQPKTSSITPLKIGKSSISTTTRCSRVPCPCVTWERFDLTLAPKL